MLARGNIYEHLVERHIERRHPRQHVNNAVLGQDDGREEPSDDSTDSEFALFRREEAKNRRWREKSRGIKPAIHRSSNNGE